MASFSFLLNIIHGATLTKSNLRYVPDEREFFGYINSVIRNSYGIPAHKQVQKESNKQIFCIDTEKILRILKRVREIF